MKTIKQVMDLMHILHTQINKNTNTAMMRLVAFCHKKENGLLDSCFFDHLKAIESQ